jgi:hydrogenase maturation protease
VTEPRIPVLVLGLGNVLCGDDGAGVAAVERLHEQWEFPEEVRVLDGGTLGLSLLPYLQSAERAILVDAILLDAEPGTIVRFDDDLVFPIARGRMSCHQVGVADVLDCARLLGQAPALSLIGIVVSEVAAMAAPTAAVSSRIDDLSARVVDELRASGFAPKRRAPGKSGARPPVWSRTGLHARHAVTTAEESVNEAGPGKSTRPDTHGVGVRGSL